MYPKKVINNQMKTFLEKQFAVDSDTTSEKKKNTTVLLTIYWPFLSSNEKEINPLMPGGNKSMLKYV